MLSICIPVYNTSIVQLVQELDRQCTEQGIPFEIICFDDASLTTYKDENKTIVAHPSVCYKELLTNIGRAAIRNLMAKEASHPYILYLDADVSISQEDFILRYMECVYKKAPVVIGGISYPAVLQDSRKKLHYTYGWKREAKPAFLRNKNPYSSFLTGNLLIQKKIVSEIKFLASLREYGHEDTLFCLELKKRAIPIVHIENKVVHEGLETNIVFIKKQLSAVQNLSSLIQQGYDMKEVSLYRMFLVLQKYKLLGIFHVSFGCIRKLVYKSLVNGWNSWLIWFDAYRLNELCERLKNKK